MQNNAPSILKGPARETFRVRGPLYCPFDDTPKHGFSFGLSYYQEEAFDYSPFTIPAWSASGSPVLVDWAGAFFGFLKYTAITDSRFAYDGRETLTVSVPKGQELMVGEPPQADDSFREYNSRVIADTGYARFETFPDFWAYPEYCTWVEQKYVSGRSTAHEVLTHEMVTRFVDTINDHGYPPGKVTIDHGWGVDPRRTGFGDWIVDSDKFPDFARTAEMIASKGHVPGLWLGLAKIHPQSKTANTYPELVGKPEVYPWQEGYPTGVGNVRERMHMLNPEGPLSEFCHQVFSRFVKMGFRKFKIDMSYHSKHDMIVVNREIYRSAKAIDPELEIEFHLPDIFGARWADTVRTNDVWCVPFKPWYELTTQRYECCFRSAPGRIINRDHIGGNHPDVREADFLAHLATYGRGVGYPAVSLLPHHLSERAIAAVGEFLWDYTAQPNAVSDF